MVNGKGSSDSRGLILDTARQLITVNGYDGMTISDLSASSRLPASSIYYHFGSKLGVLAALLERTFQELHSTLPNPGCFENSDPLDRFESWLVATCSALDRRPEYLRLLVAVSIGSHAMDESIRATVERIREFARLTWIDALTPVFATHDEQFIEDVAMLGRSIMDGLAITTIFDETTFASLAPRILTLVRGAAAL